MEERKKRTKKDKIEYWLANLGFSVCSGVSIKYFPPILKINNWNYLILLIGVIFVLVMKAYRLRILIQEEFDRNPYVKIFDDVFFAPIYEELTFRNLIIQFIMIWWNTIFAIVINSIFFTIAHFRGIFRKAKRKEIFDYQKREMLGVFLFSLLASIAFIYSEFVITISIILHIIANGSIYFGIVRKNGLKKL